MVGLLFDELPVDIHCSGLMVISLIHYLAQIQPGGPSTLLGRVLALFLPKIPGLGLDFYPVTCRGLASDLEIPCIDLMIIGQGVLKCFFPFRIDDIAAVEGHF